MKRLIFGLLVCALMATPAMAVPTLHFTEPSGAANGWTYTGAANGTFTFNLEVDQGLGSGLDGLVGAVVVVPALNVSGAPGGPYTLTPQGTGVIKITNGAASTYLQGTLGTGTVLAGGTTVAGYINFQADITGLSFPVAVPGGSAAINAIVAAGLPLDFDIAMTGGPSTVLQMMDGTLPGQTAASTYIDGATGSMTIIPAPGAILLGSIGAGLVGWLRRRRML